MPIQRESTISAFPFNMISSSSSSEKHHKSNPHSSRLNNSTSLPAAGPSSASSSSSTPTPATVSANKCSQCGTPSPCPCVAKGSWVNSNNNSTAASNGDGGSAEPQEEKNPTWTCQDCGFDNDELSNVCFVCVVPRSRPSSANTSPRFLPSHVQENNTKNNSNAENKDPVENLHHDIDQLRIAPNTNVNGMNVKAPLKSHNSQHPHVSVNPNHGPIPHRVSKTFVAPTTSEEYAHDEWTSAPSSSVSSRSPSPYSSSPDPLTPSSEPSSDRDRVHRGLVISLLPDKAFLSCAQLGISTIVDRALFSSTDNADLSLGDHIEFTISPGRIQRNRRGQSVHLATSAKRIPPQPVIIYEGRIFNYRRGQFGFIVCEALDHFTYFPEYLVDRDVENDIPLSNGTRVQFRIEDRVVVNNRGDCTYRASWIRACEPKQRQPIHSHHHHHHQHHQGHGHQHHQNQHQHHPAPVNVQSEEYVAPPSSSPVPPVPPRSNSQSFSPVSGNGVMDDFSYGNGDIWSPASLSPSKVSPPPTMRSSSHSSLLSPSAESFQPQLYEREAAPPTIHHPQPGIAAIRRGGAHHPPHSHLNNNNINNNNNNHYAVHGYGHNQYANPPPPNFNRNIRPAPSHHENHNGHHAHNHSHGHPHYANHHAHGRSFAR